MKQRGWIVASGLAVASVTAGCGYLGSARELDPGQFEREAGWIAVRDVVFQEQASDTDCGAASVAMVLSHWGQASTPESIAAECPPSKEGMRAGHLRDLIKNRGFKGYLIHGRFDDLRTELAARRPVIVGLVKPYAQGGLSHYEVVVGINTDLKRVATLDPAVGPRQNSFEGFLQEWEPAGHLAIVVIGTDRHARSGSESGSLETKPYKSPLSPLMAAPEPMESPLRRASGARQYSSAGPDFDVQSWWRHRDRF
jgi:predicted double-glycine peptidase